LLTAGISHGGACRRFKCFPTAPIFGVIPIAIGRYVGTPPNHHDLMPANRWEQWKNIIIMHKYIIFIGILIHSNVFGQIETNLIQDTWIKTKSERKDSSRIIDHLSNSNSFGIFIFGRDSLRMITDPGSENIYKYYITQNHLEYNNVSKFFIEKLSNHELIYIDDQQNMLDDKINRYYFVSEDYYIDSLIKNHLIEIDKDTIIANAKYFPYFKKDDISTYLKNALANPHQNGTINGSFIISPRNEVINITFNKIEGINNNFTNKFKDVLQTTSGNWVIPTLTKEYYFKLNFIMYFNSEIIGNNIDATAVHFFLSENFKLKIDLSMEQTRLAVISFQKGLKLLTKNKFEEAIIYFTKCIEQDSLYLDAYYNRAYTNYTINNLDKACLDWHYLKELGQKSAEKYYFQMCDK
jgi:hypothetical protein